jgi:hypothetical protein
VNNKGLIHAYKVDFGTIEEIYHSQALRSAGEALKGCVGNFIRCGGASSGSFIFAMQ